MSANTKLERLEKKVKTDKPGKIGIVFSIIGPNSTPGNHDITGRYLETYDNGERITTPITEAEYRERKKSAAKVINFGEPKG